MPSIVLVSGYICSLKSYISAALAKELGMTRLETKQLGSISTEEDKSHRYEKLAHLLRTELPKGKNIVLDGTFGKREYRQRVYDIAEQSGVEDMVVVSCSCYDKREVRRRIRERETRVKTDDVCLQEWLNQSYDNLNGDRFKQRCPSIIAVDTGEYEISSLILVSDFSHLVKDKLETIVEKLRKYFVPGYRKEAETFAKFLGDPVLFWDEPIPVEATVREFVNARRKYVLPDDASFACLSMDEIRGKGRNHYYGRYSFAEEDIDFVDFGTLGPGARKTRIFSKWANLKSMDGEPIDAVSIRFTPDPNW